MIRIKRGLALPLSGAPEQVIGSCNSVRTVAVLGGDYVGMKPTMLVQVGDRVKLGQALFSDKKSPLVLHTAPAAGVVTAINRGYQRALQSVVIEIDEANSNEDELSFGQHNANALPKLERQQIVDQLLGSGLWTALRTRPFSKVANPESRPHSLFINAMDTNPLAANPAVVLAEDFESFVIGANLLSRLAQNKTYVCHSPADAGDMAQGDYAEGVELRAFSGPHPAGLSGTHIHFTMPAGASREVWTINYQDAIAVGKLFTTGKLDTQRVISIAGPQVREPRLVRTRLGASLEELLAGELLGEENRIVSGSALGGKKAEGVECYLGRYHVQATVLREGRERVLLGYLSPGMERHSVMGIYLSKLIRGKEFAMSTNAQGSSRAMVPIGAYEKVMPLDILPTQLLRALIVGDTETAANLGALELDEEDLALCSYVCPGKYEFGPILRDNLSRIEKES